MIDDRELDEIILSLAKARWQKTAMIIAKALDQLGDAGSNDLADRVTKRLERLVGMKRLEAQGDLSRWRFSEVRLPDSTD